MADYKKNSNDRVFARSNALATYDERIFQANSTPPSEAFEAQLRLKARSESVRGNKRTNLEDFPRSMPLDIKYKTLSSVAAKAKLPFDTVDLSQRPQKKPTDRASKFATLACPVKGQESLKDDLLFLSQDASPRHQHFRSLRSHSRELAISKYQRQREQEQLIGGEIKPTEQEKGKKIPSQHSSESSSSGSSHCSASPLPFNEIDVAVASPHVAPCAVDNRKSIPLRQRIMHDYDNAIFPPSDYFRSFMEERMMRWRPPDSQFNIEETMEGNHPFQVSSDIGVQKLISKNYWDDIFSSIKKWFNGLPEVESDLENQAEVTNITSQDNRNLHGKRQTLHRSVSRINLDNTDFNCHTLDLLRRAKEIPFQANSSNSFLPPPQQPSKVRHSSQNVDSSKRSGSSKEPTRSGNPIITPRGSPFAESVLNFEKREAKSSMDQEGIRIFNAMDEDVRDLLNTFDNFFCNLWENTTDLCSC